MIRGIISVEGEGGDFPTWGSKISKLKGCREGGREKGGRKGVVTAFVPAPPQDSNKKLTEQPDSLWPWSLHSDWFH